MRVVSRNWKRMVDTLQPHLDINYYYISSDKLTSYAERTKFATSFTFSPILNIRDTCPVDQYIRNIQTTSIEKLNFIKCDEFNELNLKLLSELYRESLTSLSFEDCDLTCDQLANCLIKFTSLTYLNLENQNDITDDQFDILLRQMPSLQHLNLCNCGYLTDDNISLIGKYMKSLITLNLSNNRYLSFNGILEWDDDFQIENLYLFNCNCITNHAWYKLGWLSSLKNLHFTYREDFDQVLPAFSEIRGNTGLHGIFVDAFNHVKVEEILNSLRNLKKLDTFHVMNMTMRSHCMKLLLHWKAVGTLRSLRMTPVANGTLFKDVIHLTRLTDLNELTLTK